ncbi:MAG: B12-binding domain-containing radical SAM protein [Elusimicrobia bacterium]|nr:B12-binding domain-containing radical SAM protein [Elusimicrobiota bacterium]
MRFKKVILANLTSHETSAFKKRAVLRAGLGYIAQVLYDNNISYKVVDLSLGYNVNYLLKKIEQFNPDIIGITLLSYKYKYSYDIIKIIKKRFKDIVIVCGGPHVTTFRGTVLEECTEIDFAIAGEGEEVIVQLCAGVKYEDISGLIYRDENRIIYNEMKPFRENLDTLNFPKYINFELENYPLRKSLLSERVIPIVTSRGCPHDCIYCPVKTTIGQKFRYRNINNITEEIKYWYNIGYKRFSIVDDNFTLIRERVWQLCEEIERQNLKGLILNLPNGIRADKIDYELLEKMYSAGFRYIGFGVESGNNKILKNLKKHETIETIEKAINDACKIGYYIDLFFLVGSPGETEEDVKDSIRIASKYPVDNVFFFNLIPYPGTELFDWIKKNGHFLYSPSYYLNKINSNMDVPVFETIEFTIKSRKSMLKLARDSAKKLKVNIYIKKLSDKHIKGVFANIIANIYATNIIQRIFNDISIFGRIKTIILKI